MTVELLEDGHIFMRNFCFWVFVLHESKGLRKIPTVLNHEIGHHEGDDSTIDAPSDNRNSFAPTTQAILHFGYYLQKRQQVQALLKPGLLQGKFVKMDSEAFVGGNVQLKRMKVDG